MSVRNVEAKPRIKILTIIAVKISNIMAVYKNYP
jgi:hypothetical protein